LRKFLKKITWKTRKYSISSCWWR